MLNRNTKRTFLLAAACVATALILTGCRSTPGARMFGMRGEPSAEALAGNGPTVTYPVPPSASANPEAIASVAGGTAPQSTNSSPTSSSPSTSQVAGFDVSPGYATQATNMAAAQANGITGGAVTKSAALDGSTEGVDANPSSYAFGSKALTPKSETPTTAGSSLPLTSGSQIASTSAPLTTPSTTTHGFVPPPLSASGMGTAPSATTPGSTTPGLPASGFTLPTDSPAFAAIAPPTGLTGTGGAHATPSAPIGSSTATSGPVDLANLMPPTSIDSSAASMGPGPAAATSAEISTASAAAGYPTPAAFPSMLPPSIGFGGGATEGYMPGSTGTTSGYPTGGTTPTTSGSFYR